MIDLLKEAEQMLQSVLKYQERIDWKFVENSNSFGHFHATRNLKIILMKSIRLLRNGSIKYEKRFSKFFPTLKGASKKILVDSCKEDDDQAFFEITEEIREEASKYGFEPSTIEELEFEEISVEDFGKFLNDTFGKR